MRHFQVDAHIYSKREVKRISRKSGKSRSEVVGAMICLWGYVAVHSRDTGTIDGDYDDLADELDQEVGFWEVVESEGWLKRDPENVTITVPEWAERFYTGSNSERCRKYRKTKAEQQSERVATLSQHDHDTEENSRDTERARRDHIVENSNSIKENKRIENRIEEPAQAGTATRLNEFWTNLTRAGMPLDAKQPYWLRQAMNNGQGELLLAASKEIGNTKFLEGDNPTTLANFNPKTPKAQAWLERLAGGEFSSGGKIAVPEGKPQKEVFPPAGKKMTPGEAKEWVNESEGNRHAYEVWRERSRRDTGRDSSRGEPVGVDVEESQADIVTEPVQRPTLRDADEDFSTKAAQAAALNQIASWSEENGKD